MGYLMSKEQAWRARQERHDAEMCDNCPHARGWHAVDYIPAQLEVRDDQIVEVAPATGNTISCRVDSCGCTYPNKCEE